jgi:hypothetical protein
LGSLTSGATMATLNCLLAARESIKEIPIEKRVIYLTDQAHHSVNRALKTLKEIRAAGKNIQFDMINSGSTALGTRIEMLKLMKSPPDIIVAEIDSLKAAVAAGILVCTQVSSI